MKYSAKTKPGMGDPYWYEWSVGQQYIIDMLNPDNNIKCVELQANVKLGLDDVVVTYEGGEKLFVQVKHTRSNNTLTFGDLVSIDNTSEDGSHRYSLLGELAMCLNGLKKKLFGMESFKHSNIMCGLSKTALLAFGWHIEVGVNGMKLFDERGEQIGWFEHHCGSRSDMGNRYQRNQPYMQRWIVQKEKLDKSMREASIPHSVERVVDFCIQDYE